MRFHVLLVEVGGSMEECEKMELGCWLAIQLATRNKAHFHTRNSIAFNLTRINFPVCSIG